MPLLKTARLEWPDAKLKDVGGITFDCGYCGARVAPSKGWPSAGNHARILICPNCTYPTFIGPHREQIPGSLAGRAVNHLPEDVRRLYEEARECVAVLAYTASVMLCRKLLMHIAVEKGAQENQGFKMYVNWLADEHWVPPNGREWVAHIKDKGNEANHEIKLMTKQDANDLLRFVEALLRSVYELPKSFAERAIDTEEKPTSIIKASPRPNDNVK